jgi:hypothetical protein
MGPGVRIAIPCGKSTISQGGCGYPEMSCCSVSGAHDRASPNFMGLVSLG